MDTAQHLLGGLSFRLSENAYDWLGQGAYFWENDPQRAHEWAQKWCAHSPCVVGAAIELGNCLDLTTRRGANIVRTAFKNYKDLQSERKQPLPAICR